ncbi:FitA-like ribbon-helix-helix domain-containing protein [Acidisphaera rubrifaciens]|uniref:FitA-like ribbon-helix-helix domain-containing protein n=1 Tax=Acidisphaera rubrifaciens TaxID=50715 RepID=UPI00130ED47D
MDLSIRNAPAEIVQGLQSRAAANHRTVEAELLAIVTEAVSPPLRSSPAEVLRKARTLGLPVVSESTGLIRADRDRRQGR